VQAPTATPFDGYMQFQSCTTGVLGAAATHDPFITTSPHQQVRQFPLVWSYVAQFAPEGRRVHPVDDAQYPLTHVVQVPTATPFDGRAQFQSATAQIPPSGT